MHRTKLSEFFAKGRQRHYSSGELITSGEAPAAVFYIASGFVKVYSISDDGERYVHSLYREGEIFPFIWAVKGTRRRVFYEAAGPVSAWTVPRADFIGFLKADKSAAYEALEQAIDQFHIYADRLENLQYKTAGEKVIYRLLFLAGRFGAPADGGIVINAPVTHEFIAETINLTRETVSREIEKLEKGGLLRRRGGQVVIVDTKKLARQFSEPVSIDIWGLG